jgi:hypothetical protein
MNAQERADSIIKDILDNHLPRVIEGLKLGYVDENQVLVIYDHAVRARILKEFAEAQPALEQMDNLGRLNRELEAEWKRELELEKIEQAQGKTVGDIPPMINVPTPGIPCGVLTQRENVRAIVIGRDTDGGGYNHYLESFEDSGGVPTYKLTDKREKAFVGSLTHMTGLAERLNNAYHKEPATIHFNTEVTHVPLTPAVLAVPRAIKDEIESGVAIIQGRSTVTESYECFVQELGEPTSAAKMTTEKGKAKVLPVDVAKKAAKDLTRTYADMEFTHQVVSDIGWKPTKDQLQCACGGLIKEHPTSIETLLKCERCGRVYTDEQDVFNVRKTEVIGGTKCADATYWSTGTLAGGTTPVPMETEINLNGRKVTIQATNGKFILTYEQIVRMAVNQRRGHLNAFTGSDAELPHETVVYHHRVPWEKLHGERDGSLWKGKSVECTPGMVIDCCNTGNA